MIALPIEFETVEGSLSLLLSPFNVISELVTSTTLWIIGYVLPPF